MITEKEKERRLVFARERSAQAWCTDKTSHIEMDVRLAEAFAEILVEEMYKPHLGCASTRQLINEIVARMPIDLEYKTVPDDPDASRCEVVGPPLAYYDKVYV